MTNKIVSEPTEQGLILRVEDAPPLVAGVQTRLSTQMLVPGHLLLSADGIHVGEVRETTAGEDLRWSAKHLTTGARRGFRLFSSAVRWVEHADALAIDEQLAAVEAIRVYDQELGVLAGRTRMRLQVPVLGALGIKVYDPQETPHTTQQPIAVIDRQETTGWRAELWFDDPEFGQTISGDSAQDVLAWVEQRWAEWEHYDRYDRFPAYHVPAAEPAGPPFALALAGLPFPGSTYLKITVGGLDQAERIATVDHLRMLLDLRPGQAERNSDGVWRYRCKPFPDGVDVSVGTRIDPPSGTPDDRDEEIAYLRAQVERYRLAAANALGDHAPTVHDTSTPPGGILPEGVDGFAVGRSVR